jgi:hypothetical protein
MRTVIAVAALASTLAAGAGGTARPLQSWSDRGHRWIVGDTETGPRPPGAVRCGAQVCESNDGGRHWRRRFSCCEAIVDLVRTSSHAGVVTGSTAKGVSAWWTVGGGRWFPTQRIDGDVEGRGQHLFWHRFGTTLYEVRPWPPAGPIPCVHPTKTWPTICDPQDSVLEADPVAIIPDGQLAGLANVPGGIVAPVAGTPPRVLIRRNDDTRLAALSTDAEICSGTEPVRVQVRWPRLFVPACGAVGHRGWRSQDGGKTWEFAAK